VQAKELEADARRRLAQILNGGPGAAPGGQPTVSAVPVAPAASAPSRVKAASVLAVPSMAAAEPEPYVLLGIVGKPGSETAEIREPTGRVAVVERGQRVGQWIVSSITAEDIRLSWAGRTAKKKPAPTPVRLYVGNTFH
jgi:type IV pilus biogenesis protein PilP